MPSTRMRRIKAKDISRLLWDRIAIIRAMTPQSEIEMSAELEFRANGVINAAIEQKDIVPILNAAPDIRLAVLSRMQAFIVSSTTDPDRVIARVARDADDGVLIAEALKVLQHRSPSRLVWRMIYER